MYVFLDSIWLQEVYLHHRENVREVYNWSTANLVVHGRFEELDSCEYRKALTTISILEEHLKEKTELLSAFGFDVSNFSQGI
jgi:hypothetical protein